MIERNIAEKEGMLSDRAVDLINHDLVPLLEMVKDLVEQLEPKLKELSKEAGPAVNAIKANLDREETLILVEKLTSNTGTLIDMVSFMEALNDLRKELEPKLKELSKEAGPAVNAIKANLDREETLILVTKLTEIVGSPVVQKLIGSAATALTDIEEKEIAPVSPLGIFSELRDEDVQRALGFLFHFLKQLGRGLKA